MVGLVVSDKLLAQGHEVDSLRPQPDGGTQLNQVAGALKMNQVFKGSSGLWWALQKSFHNRGKFYWLTISRPVALVCEPVLLDSFPAAARDTLDREARDWIADANTHLGTGG
jgi:hypothetical protein